MSKQIQVNRVERNYKTDLDLKMPEVIAMIIKKNVGYWDSIFRTIVGAAIVSIGMFYENYWGLLGLILVFSGVVSFCPVYRLFNIATVKPDLEREN
jgi:hypothetical protein